MPWCCFTAFENCPQGRFQFYVRIDDKDKGADDLVDRVAFNVYHPANDAWSPKISKEGVYNQVVLKARFKINCDANFYGTDCFTYCVATDNSRGHYTCDSNGGKKCKAGYQNPSTNCITRERPN